MRHDYLKIPSKIQTYKNTLEHKHSLYPYIAILFPYKEKALPCMVWRSHVADVPRMRNNDSIKNTQIHDPPLIHSNSWPPTHTLKFVTPNSYTQFHDPCTLMYTDRHDPRKNLYGSSWPHHWFESHRFDFQNGQPKLKTSIIESY